MHGDSGTPVELFPETQRPGSDIENDFQIGQDTEPLVIGNLEKPSCNDWKVLPFDHHDFLTAPLSSVKRKLEETETELHWTPPKRKKFGFGTYFGRSSPCYPPAEKRVKTEHKPNVKINFSASLIPLKGMNLRSAPPTPEGSSSPIRIPSVSELEPIGDHVGSTDLTVAVRICPFSTLRQAIKQLEESGGIRLDTRAHDWSLSLSVSLVFGHQIFVKLSEEHLDVPLVEAIQNESLHEGHIRDITIDQPDYKVDFTKDEQETAARMEAWLQWAPPKQLLDHAIRHNALEAVRAFFAQNGCTFTFEHEMPKLLGDVLVKRRRDLFRAIFDGLLRAGCDIFAHWDPPGMLDHAWEEFLNVVGWEASSEFRWLISLGLIHAESVPAGRRDLVELVRARRIGTLVKLGLTRPVANIITEF